MTPSGAGSVSVSPDRIDYVDDSVVELTATPDAGWSFTGWTGDASGTTSPLQVTVSADLEIGATFVEDVPVSVSTSVAGDGVVSVSPEQPTYAIGDQVTLTATPGPDQRFVGWSGDLSGSTNPLTFTITTNTTVTATFQPIPDGVLRIMPVGDSITAGALRSPLGPREPTAITYSAGSRLVDP